MSDVSPGRICKFNSAAGANVQSCGDYFPPSPPPALGKFANLIPPFPTSVYLKNLTMVFKDFHKSTLTNHIIGAIGKKREVAQLNFRKNIWRCSKYFANFHRKSSLSALDQSGRPSWVAPANHQFPNLAGIGEKGNLPIWKIYRFLIDSDSCVLLLVTSAPLVTFFWQHCQPLLIAMPHGNCCKRSLSWIGQFSQISPPQYT